MREMFWMFVWYLQFDIATDSGRYDYYHKVEIMSLPGPIYDCITI